MRFFAVVGLALLWFSEANAQNCAPPKVSGKVVCPGDSTFLVATAPGGTYQWFDAISGGQLLATGDTFRTSAILHNTTYFVQTTIGGCSSIRTPVNVAIRPNPSVSGANICAGNSVTLTAVAPGGDYEWFDSASGGNSLQAGNTFSTPVLNTATIYYVQTTVEGCVSGRTPVMVNVAPSPEAPQASDASICFGSAVTLSASGSTGIYQWFTTPTGGTPLISSPDYTTPGLITTTTFYVQTVINGCTSSRTPVKVTVYPIPSAPPISGVSICSGSTANLVASDSQGTFQWFGVSSRGNVLHTGDSFTTPALTRTTTYYVQSIVNGCTSARLPVTVTVKKASVAPTVSGATACSGSTATLTASGPGGTYTWYDAPSGGNLLETGESYTPPVLTASAIYYVQTIIDDCASARTAVTLTISPVPSAPKVSDASICSGTSTTLTASGAGGGIFEWYDSETDGNLLSKNPQYTTAALIASATFYVQRTLNGCVSPRTTVTVTVNTALPPTAEGVTICSESSATLTANAPEGILQWYDAATGGNLLATGTSFKTPSLTSATTYYIQTIVNGCISARIPVTVKITGIISPGFKYETDTYCVTAKSAIPKILVEEGGTFTAVPAGLVFKDNTTGEIDFQRSKEGSYIIFFTSNGPCPHISQGQFAITNLLGANFSYNGPYCQADGIAKPTFSNGSGAGTFTATPEGLVFSSYGAIDLAQSRPGVYTVKNYLPATGDCVSTTAITSIIINGSPLIEAGIDQSVAPGSPVLLTGTAKGATNFRWYGGSGTFSNPTSLTSKYDPGAGETRTTLFLSAASTGACAPVKDSLIISMNLIAPNASGASVCYGTAATLSATASIGSPVWYDAPIGGNALIENATYVTPPLLKTTTFYVQSNIAGNTSLRTPVTVAVNGPPTLIVDAVTVCSMSSANLTAKGGGTFKWFDTAIEGNLLASTSNFTTPALSSSTTYYVEETLNGCISPRMPVTVTVNLIPEVISAAIETICNSVALNYQIIASLPGTTFSWSRKAVPTLVNPAVKNQASSIITEVLTTTASTPVDVTYVITPIYKGCPGPAFEYVVTIDPSPIVTSPTKGAVCNNSASNYSVQYNLPGTAFNWSRAGVAGISNSAISGQSSPIIREVLNNTTNAPIDVTYVFNQGYNGCAAPPFYYVVTVNPIPNVISKESDYLCNGNSFTYNIKSNVVGAVFTWSRPEQSNIKNAAVINASSSSISEILTNTGNTPVEVVYTIIPTANGCTGPAFSYLVTVMPTSVAPLINTSSAVCVGKPISLTTIQISGATYLWTGPNGFTSTQQNPTIPQATPANAGDYSLIMTINGCAGLPSVKTIKVNELPVANAGNDQTWCSNKPILLYGKISGGATTGIWATSGTGSFSASNTALDATYIASEQDKETGSVKLTLTSTNDDNCSPSTSAITITLAQPPIAEAGPDQNVCSQDKQVLLSGKISLAKSGFWTTSGSGTFSPSISDLNAVYIPSSSDIFKGNVMLTLNATGSNVCTQVTDAVNIKFTAPPTVDIGPDVLVPFSKTVTLNPSVSENNVKYLWTPNVNMDNNTIRNPTITGVADQVYTLTVTDSRGCVTEDKVFVDVLNPLKIPNTFTPNGDGINDVWNIPEITTYLGNTVTIFNRYGAKIFASVGYNTVWDGNVNGVPAPGGTYYYIIDTQFKGLLYSGCITIIR